MTSHLEKILLDKFGYSTFRPGQKEIIQSVLNKEDVLAILPTGMGKSLCYQVPGYLLPYSVIIISPLLSLMQDQVDQLKKMGEKRVVAVNSFLSVPEKNALLQKLETYKFIFLSPEMVMQEQVKAKLQTMHISLIVADEAHCISQWGFDFRPDYLKLGVIRNLIGNPLTLALTATASKEVREDIAEKLHLDEWNEVVYSVDRPAISLVVEHVSHFQEKIERTMELVKFLKGPGIIYFSSKKMAEQTAAYLREQGLRKVMAYHGGLDSESRILIQQQFIHGQLDVICATSAFGMGVNKENVRYVIHFHMPMQIESYLQEIGRAARDGFDSVAVLLYSPGDEQLAFQLAEGELPDPIQMERLFTFLADRTVDYQEIDQYREEIIAFCGFTEIQWRITEDYLSSLEVIDYDKDKRSFIGLIEARLKVKNLKIKQMLEWVHTQDCKRAAILTHFNEQLTTRPDNCCSTCGLEMNNFKEDEKEADEPLGFDWKQELASILLFRPQP